MVTQVQTTQVSLYEQVAERILRMIDSGALPAGSRVPSVRKLSDQFDVSIATVLAAYRALESRGRLDARPQSGFYVKTLPASKLAEVGMTRPPRVPLSIETGALMMQMLHSQRRPNIVPLGAALGTIPEMPIRQIHRLMASIGRAQPMASAAYDPPPGCPAYRKQVAKLAVSSGCSLSPDDIVTTSGSQEAISLCLRAVANPGDHIAVESPAYYGVLQVIDALGMKAVEVATNPRDGICLDDLREAITHHDVKAVVVVSNFSNPLGSVIPDSVKPKLVTLCEEMGVPLIEDDIYGDLPHDGLRPQTCKAHDRTGNVMLCSSFSKTIAPGLRVGWCAPGRWFEQVARLKVCFSIATPTLPQLAVAQFLEQGGYEHYLRKQRRVYKRQVDQMRELAARHFPEQTKTSRPAGGYVLWVEMPHSVDTLKLCEEALKKNISIAPGVVFGARPEYRNCLRLNCGMAWSDRIEKAMEELGLLAKAMMRQT